MLVVTAENVQGRSCNKIAVWFESNVFRALSSAGDIAVEFCRGCR